MKARAPRQSATLHAKPVTSVNAERPQASVRVPLHDPALPERARADWLAANWAAVADLSPQTVAEHPERASLSALLACAALQLGDRHGALAHARRAVAWGCDKRYFGQLLLAGARHTLGRASIAARRELPADAHFAGSVALAHSTSEVRRLTHMRHVAASADLQALIASRQALDVLQAGPVALKMPDWIGAIAAQCLKSPDLHDSVDAAIEEQLSDAGERIHLLTALAAHFTAQQDHHTAVHFLHQARSMLPDDEPVLRAQVARQLVAAGSVETAFDTVVEAAVPAALTAPADAAVLDALLSAYWRMRDQMQARIEHGHHVLMGYLEKHWAQFAAGASGRTMTLIEIGTTREDVPGQGSTRKLAEFCLEKGLHFVTVDMDPHNSRMARQTFERLGAPFEAVTMKGEDYLREAAAPIDLVFLDAYDFDHGKHSELRQSRYQKFLGSRIDELACHQMHLDCAQSLVGKLSEQGLICIDDTWLQAGKWTAKGTLAMPFLLANGYTVVETRNRAALLRRRVSADAGVAR